jgi:hypothetical protein
MEAGKQQWWLWVVTGSPRQCRPDRDSLAVQGVGMIACKEALTLEGGFVRSV